MNARKILALGSLVATLFVPALASAQTYYAPPCPPARVYAPAPVYNPAPVYTTPVYAPPAYNSYNSARAYVPAPVYAPQARGWFPRRDEDRGRFERPDEGRGWGRPDEGRGEFVRRGWFRGWGR
jgi:hypothetical protein